MHLANVFRIRLRLWMLLALVVVIALPMALWANRARDQQIAVEQALAVRGFVAYAHEIDARGNLLAQKPETPGPAWLRRMLGDDYFRNVQGIFFLTPRRDDDATNAERLKRDRDVLPRVASLPGLKQLTIGEATDESLSVLRANRQLETLTLNGARFTDAGIASLGILPYIENFTIMDATRITDASCATLGRWPKLSRVVLYHADIGDRGIAALAECRLLSSLIVLKNDGWKHTTDAALASLSEARSLTFLSLLGTSITDDGVAALARLPNLETLEIDSERLTDRSLEIVEGFPKLKSVSLQSGRITPEAKKRLSDARPGLKVR